MNVNPGAPPPRREREPGAAGAPGADTLRWIEREIASALAAIRYGSIEIVIQDSRVVQIERREKVRFDTAGRTSP